MRKLLFVLFAAILSMPLSAQIEIGKYYWNQGPMTLDLFQKRHTGADDKLFTYMEWQLSTSDTTIKIGNTHFVSDKVDLYMFNELSWYDPDRNPDWALRYNQAEFDMVEVLRRKYQNTLNSDTIFWEDRSYFNKLLQVKVETFEAETGYGADTAAIVRYEEQIREDLKNVVENPFRTTESRLKPAVQIGMNVTYDLECFFKPMSKGYNPAHGIQGMIYLYYGNFFTNAAFTGSWSGKLKSDDFYHDPDPPFYYQWQKDKPCRSQKFLLNFGYDVINRQHITIAPVVGIGSMVLKQDTGMRINDGPIQFSAINGGKLASGLSIGYKYKRTCSKWLMTENMVKVNLMSSYTVYHSDIPSNWSIMANFTFETKRWVKK